MRNPADDDDVIYVEVGRRMRAHRIAAGKSQREVAELLGMVRGSISNVEAGRQALPLHKLALLALELQIPVVELLPDWFLE